MEKKHSKILIGLGISTCIFLLLLIIAGILGYMAYKPFVAQQYYSKGVSYKHKGWVKDSKEMMNKAIKEAPNSSIAKEAQEFLKTRLPKSNNISDKAIRLNIKAYNIQKEANQLPQKEKEAIKEKSQEAINIYKESIEESPEFEWPYSNIGGIYFYEGKELNQAEKYFKMALEINPDYLNARMYLGLTYFKMARNDIKKETYNEAKPLLEKAIKELNKAYKLDTKNNIAKENLSDAKEYLKLVKKKVKTSQ